MESARNPQNLTEWCPSGQLLDRVGTHFRTPFFINCHDLLNLSKSSCRLNGTENLPSGTKIKENNSWAAPKTDRCPRHPPKHLNVYFYKFGTLPGLILNYFRRVLAPFLASSSRIRLLCPDKCLQMTSTRIYNLKKKIHRSVEKSKSLPVSAKICQGLDIWPLRGGLSTPRALKVEIQKKIVTE